MANNYYFGLLEQKCNFKTEQIQQLLEYCAIMSIQFSFLRFLLFSTEVLFLQEWKTSQNGDCFTIHTYLILNRTWCISTKSIHFYIHYKLNKILWTLLQHYSNANAPVNQSELHEEHVNNGCQDKKKWSKGIRSLCNNLSILFQALLCTM
jgi:hypothetical protein